MDEFIVFTADNSGLPVCLLCGEKAISRTNPAFDENRTYNDLKTAWIIMVFIANH